MKITRKQLKKIVTEAQLNEMWGQSVETGSPLIDFAREYAGLGSAVQEQFDAIVGAWFNGGPDSPEWTGTVLEQNTNALELIQDRMFRHLVDLDNDESVEILEAINTAVDMSTGSGEDF